MSLRQHPVELIHRRSRCTFRRNGASLRARAGPFLIPNGSHTVFLGGRNAVAPLNSPQDAQAGNQGTATVIHSIIVGNAAVGGAAGSGGQAGSALGGGVFNYFGFAA